MSEVARKLFEGLRAVGDAVQAAAPSVQNILSQTGAEMSRLGTQGAMELSSALFSGQGFVPYGPGQYTPTPEQEQGRPEPGRER